MSNGIDFYWASGNHWAKIVFLDENEKLSQIKSNLIKYDIKP